MTGCRVREATSSSGEHQSGRPARIENRRNIDADAVLRPLQEGLEVNMSQTTKLVSRTSASARTARTARAPRWVPWRSACSPIFARPRQYLHHVVNLSRAPPRDPGTSIRLLSGRQDRRHRDRTARQVYAAAHHGWRRTSSSPASSTPAPGIKMATCPRSRPRPDQGRARQRRGRRGESAKLLDDYNDISTKFAEPMDDAQMDKKPLDKQAPSGADRRPGPGSTRARYGHGRAPAPPRRGREHLGGERRRVALRRRSPSRTPPLDEPTHHLDAESVAWLERYCSSRAPSWQ